MYGIASYVENYDIIRPLVGLDVRSLSSDPIENIFSVLKYFCYGEVTMNNLKDALARWCAHKILTARQFVARGFTHPPVKKRIRLSASRVPVKGNCKSEDDNGENEYKSINRTHAVNRPNMNKIDILKSHNNAALYQHVNL
jgi:hypothetical protein